MLAAMSVLPQLQRSVAGEGGRLAKVRNKGKLVDGEQSPRPGNSDTFFSYNISVATIASSSAN